jgi:hypothetical protein
MAQGRRLARRTARHKRVRPLLDLPVNQGGKSGLIDPTVYKGRDQSGNGTMQHADAPSSTLKFILAKTT